MSVIFVVFHSRPPFNVAVPHGLVTKDFSCCQILRLVRTMKNSQRRHDRGLVFVRIGSTCMFF